MKKTESLIAISFLLVIIFGALLLMLPFSTTEGSIHPVDALFTSASAVTVTGLVVMNTEKDFTLFGQVVIMLLIQIGGLGFMTFSTFVIILMEKAVSLKDLSVIDATFTPGSYKSAKDLARKIVLMTFGIEFLGALSLFFQFTQLKGLHRVFASVFHAVAAFCNAGFSIFGNNLENYPTHWGVNITIMMLIIIGGIGFLVLNDVSRFIRRKIKHLSKLTLHSKLVLITTGILVVGGFLIIFIEELLNPNSPFSLEVKILSSLFHSVAARTAGFNTVNLNLFSLGSIFILILLMFIGASPGSTGGGIKTTSASTVLFYFRSRLKGKEMVEVFYRSIPVKNIEKGFIVIIISSVLVGFSFFLLLTFEPKFRPIDLFFETVSAFGTVGLSLGITSKLTALSKLTIIFTMYAGRIGPLTLLLALSNRKESRAVLKYPEEEIMIG